eukprot:10569058-Lingulodinium_polyedra.AAC.1
MPKSHFEDGGWPNRPELVAEMGSHKPRRPPKLAVAGPRPALARRRASRLRRRPPAWSQRLPAQQLTGVLPRAAGMPERAAR